MNKEKEEERGKKRGKERKWDKNFLGRERKGKTRQVKVEPRCQKNHSSRQTFSESTNIYENKKEILKERDGEGEGRENERSRNLRVFDILENSVQVLENKENGERERKERGKENRAQKKRNHETKTMMHKQNQTTEKR